MNNATLNDERTVGTTRATGLAPAPELAPVSAHRQILEPEATSEGLRDDRDGRRHPAADVRRKSAKRYLIGGTIALVAGVAVGLYYLRFVAPFESTDDAFIEGHVTQIAPQVSGRVQRVLVTDNQLVNAGDVLVQIDPSDYQVRLDQERAHLASAKSRLSQAQAQLTVDQARVAQEKANVIAAEAEAKRATADSARYQNIGTSGVSESQIDLAATQARSADAQLLVARNKEAAAESQITLDQANIESAAADVKNSEAAVHQAELNLSYTEVKAHDSGFVTHKTVEAGSYAQPGQALLAVVPKEVWVVANFKETQLKHMRAGQPVTVKVDAYPQFRLKGRLDSIQAGSGARFSMFPPENATGNYVKVVQRVPVKIVLEDVSGINVVLGPGMSVAPKVRVH